MTRFLMSLIWLLLLKILQILNIGYLLVSQEITDEIQSNSSNRRNSEQTHKICLENKSTAVEQLQPLPLNHWKL